jgi:hypothetical protein
MITFINVRIAARFISSSVNTVWLSSVFRKSIIQQEMTKHIKAKKVAK